MGVSWQLQQTDRTTRLWEVASLESEALAVRHPNYVNNISFAPDSALLAIGSSGDSSGIWDLTTNSFRFKLNLNGVEVVRFSVDGRYLTAGSRGGRCKNVECREWEPTH